MKYASSVFANKTRAGRWYVESWQAVTLKKRESDWMKLRVLKYKSQKCKLKLIDYNLFYRENYVVYSVKRILDWNCIIAMPVWFYKPSWSESCCQVMSDPELWKIKNGNVLIEYRVKLSYNYLYGTINICPLSPWDHYNRDRYNWVWLYIHTKIIFSGVGFRSLILKTRSTFGSRIPTYGTHKNLNYGNILAWVAKFFIVLFYELPTTKRWEPLI
jgi:hypothetical protein